MERTFRKARAIAQSIERAGWCVTPDFLPQDTVRRLREEARSKWEEGSFRHARVGYGQSLELRPEIRTDRVLWLERDAVTPAGEQYFGRLEALRLALNRRLFLGLFEVEAHLACYPPGACYRRHLDQFRETRHRVITAILYLNEDWKDEDGGQLRLYLTPEEGAAFEDILPRGGTLVTFLSARFYHEVLPARRERWSITGWFTVRR